MPVIQPSSSIVRTVGKARTISFLPLLSFENHITHPRPHQFEFREKQQQQTTTKTPIIIQPELPSGRLSKNARIAEWIDNLVFVVYSTFDTIEAILKRAAGVTLDIKNMFSSASWK